MHVSKLRKNGGALQVSIPREVCRAAGFEPYDHLLFAVRPEGGIIAVKLDPTKHFRLAQNLLPIIQAGDSE